MGLGMFWEGELTWIEPAIDAVSLAVPFRSFRYMERWSMLPSEQQRKEPKFLDLDSDITESHGF